ncbi:UDP glycosyltransferase 9-like isoform X2 [Salvia splendens]|uniref:UDP glycosyltransferase 9-like isoform X2 n=1 Tax=Salvia splendens TaxID=180675 RepID=UPI001C26575E|nr:UDP glycosyltransferase 9-like isoform X2 [Salvia splendens]
MAAHVLVLPYPGQGHINPALAFATRLASMSLSVTVLITTDLISKATVSSSSSASVSIARISDGKESVEGEESFEAYFKRFTAVLSANLAEFIDHNPAYKLLVYDSAMPWAMDVARARDLLCAPFFTMSAAVSAIFYHLKIGGLKYPYEECEAVRLPSLPCLAVKDLPSLSTFMDANQTILKLLCDQFLNLDKADWIFINTFDMLEPEIVEWMARKWPIKTIGPTILLNHKDNNNQTTINLLEPKHDACTQWLDSKETASVVYVSFGSIASLGKPQMEELVHGLVASNRHFLWVVRASEADKLPRDFNPGEKGLVVEWCNQPAVLAHRAVACFVSHCGWNSTLEAVGHGVPVVALPQWVDQTTDAKFVEDVWGIGVVIKGCGREEIAECIEGVVGGERGVEMRRKACEFRKLAKDAVECGGTSINNIQHFVEELLCRYWIGWQGYGQSTLLDLLICDSKKSKRSVSNHIINLFEPKQDEDCQKWLDAKGSGSVVYVSFGSLASLQKEQMEELAHGLALSNCPFLWVPQVLAHSAVWGFRIGVRAGEDGIIGREEISTQVKQVVEGDEGIELKKNACKWKSLADEAVEQGGTSATNIDEFVSTLKKL